MQAGKDVLLTIKLRNLSFPKPSMMGYLFNVLIKPVLEYASEIWSHALPVCVMKIQKQVLKTCLRCLYSTSVSILAVYAWRTRKGATAYH